MRRQHTSRTARRLQGDLACRPLARRPCATPAHARALSSQHPTAHTALLSPAHPPQHSCPSPHSVRISQTALRAFHRTHCPQSTEWRGSSNLIIGARAEDELGARLEGGGVGAAGAAAGADQRCRALLLPDQPAVHARDTEHVRAVPGRERVVRRAREGNLVLVHHCKAVVGGHGRCNRPLARQPRRNGRCERGCAQLRARDCGARRELRGVRAVGPALDSEAAARCGVA
eukprot:353813-Rhodomonas_salina.4